MTDFSYQLYSSRNFGPLADTLSMVAEMGYAQVEGYGALYKDAAAVETLKRHLGATGLTMPTGHFGLDMVQADPAGVVEIARAVGINTVFIPYIAEQDRDAAGWAAFGAELAEAGKPIQDAGLAYGWHNHAFEFADLGGQDKPLDLILQASDTMMLEFDVAWAHVAGEDPALWIAKYADRLISAHVKDVAEPGDCADEDGWADVGHGTMDWPALFVALRDTPTRYFVMEHDNPSDDRRFAQRALAAAQSF